MNTVQGTYGFIMSILIVYAYEYFGDFKVAVIVHCISNVMAYCLFYTSMAVSGFISWPVCVISLAIAGICLLQLKKQKSVF